MTKSIISVLLFSMTFVTGYIHAAEPASAEPVPRSQQFPWMSVSTGYHKHADDVKVAEQLGPVISALMKN